MSSIQGPPEGGGEFEHGAGRDETFIAAHVTTDPDAPREFAPVHSAPAPTLLPPNHPPAPAGEFTEAEETPEYGLDGATIIGWWQPDGSFRRVVGDSYERTDPVETVTAAAAPVTPLFPVEQVVAETVVSGASISDRLAVMEQGSTILKRDLAQAITEIGTAIGELGRRLDGLEARRDLSTPEGLALEVERCHDRIRQLAGEMSRAVGVVFDV